MLKSKTVWAGIITIITSVGMYATGEMTFVQLLQTAPPAILAIFLRHGIQKSNP